MKKFLYNYQIFCFSLFIIISCNKEDSSKSKEDYYLGGISLSRNESLTIENKNILINGNITLNDNSSLIITDSTINFSQSYSQQYRLQTHNYSSLQINNVSIPPQQTWMNWGYYDNSSITQTKFVHDSNLWQEVHGSNNLLLNNSSASFTFMESSTAKMVSTNADYVQIEMGLPNSGSPYSFSFPNNQNSVSWTSPENLPYSITFTNANISSIDFDIHDGIDVTVNSTNNVRFGWLFGLYDSTNGGFTDNISGLKKMTYSDTTFSSGSGSRQASIRLINSSVYDWWPTVYSNHTLYLEDCALADPRSNNNSKVNINNSSLTMFGSNNSSTVNINNSTIDQFLILKDNSTINMTNVNFNGSITAESGTSLYKDGVKIAP